LERGHDRGGSYGRTLSHHSGRRMQQQKKVKNTIHRGLRWPRTYKSHTTINKKHAGGMNEGQERRFNQHGSLGGAQFDCFGDDQVGQGGKTLK
jgi:hypothetical protein